MKHLTADNQIKSCADPGIKSGGGIQVNPTKKSSDNVVFLSPQLILQKSTGQFQRILSFFKVPEGVQNFPGGVQLFPGGGGGPIAYSL